jgi:ribosomal-protein-alanine N-acetyltransferase
MISPERGGSAGPQAFPEQIETERLICERLASHHLPELCTVLLDPLVIPTLLPAGAPVPTEADVEESLAASIEHWEHYGFGLWLLRDRTTGATLGRGGLVYTNAYELAGVEAAWAIVSERWGEGLATEMARAAVGFGFRALELHELIAVTLPHNRASRRVMEKSGFSYEREIMYAGLQHVLYRQSAPPPLVRSTQSPL